MHTAIKGLIEPHFDYFSAVCDGLTQQLIVRNFKNFKIVLSELSLILRMIRAPDIFLTRLAGTIYRLEGLNKRANLMYWCINNLVPAYLCNLFAPRIPNYYFRNAKKKLMLPKPRTDNLKRSFSYRGALLWNNLPFGNTYTKFLRSLYEKFP